MIWLIGCKGMLGSELGRQLTANKINWVDSQNKKFGLSPEGMNIMKLMAYGENAKFGEIEVMIKKK